MCVYVCGGLAEGDDSVGGFTALGSLVVLVEEVRTFLVCASVDQDVRGGEVGYDVIHDG